MSLRRMVILFVLAQLDPAVSALASPQEMGWKAGVATTRVTPRQNMWMAGYASRDKPSEGVAQDLFAKALALEDAAGVRLVILTADLIGIPRPLRDQVEREVNRRFGLPPAALLMNASHTHCGPAIRLSRFPVMDIDQVQKDLITSYVSELEGQLVELVGRALDNLAPARIGYSRARAGFAMNRRLPTPQGFRNSPNPDGPVDHDVPVLRVEAPGGALRAVLFGYACHNTTLSFYQFCGDYAGYAQEYLERAHPDVTALFMTGCGGDQNPYPRRTLELARQHGRSLANAVETALLPEPHWLQPSLQSALEETVLEFAPIPGRPELEALTRSENRTAARHARILLQQLDEQGKVDLDYPYPVQVVNFGNHLVLVALAGEVVVDYSLRLKRELPAPAVWVAGYSNDVFGYVPSLRVLKEGGYEGGEAMRNGTLPGPFAPSVEEKIIAQVLRLFGRVFVTTR